MEKQKRDGGCIHPLMDKILVLLFVFAFVEIEPERSGFKGNCALALGADSEYEFGLGWVGLICKEMKRKEERSGRPANLKELHILR